MTELTVTSYVTVPQHCPIRCRVVGDHVEFSFGGPREPFECAFDPAALSEFIHLGTAALAKLEQHQARENHACTTPAP